MDPTEQAARRRVRQRELVFGLIGPLWPSTPRDWAGGAMILLYHRIAPRGGHTDDPFSLSLDRFEAQLDWLAPRYTVVTVGELVRRMAGGEGAGLLAITFDDGYDCTVARALPALRARGLPATVFIDTGRLDSGSSALRTSDLARLVEGGMEVGAHTVSHPDLTRTDDDRLARELAAARARLESILGEAVCGFAAPYGAMDARVMAAVRATGYQYACSCEQDRTNRPGDDLFRLARVEINAWDGPRRFQAKLAGRYSPLYAVWRRWRRLTPELAEAR